MADQVLRYKVELDDQDLAQQLQDIRQRINSEMSEITSGALLSAQNSAVTDPSSVLNLPTTFSAAQAPINPAYASGNIFTGAIEQPMSYNGAYPTYGPVQAVSNQVSGAFAPVQIGSSALASDVRSVSDNISQSLQSARNDVNELSQNVSAGIDQIGSSQENKGYFSSLMGSVGFGYDQRDPVFKGDYRESNMQAVNEVNYDEADSALNTGMDVALLAGSFISGPAGWVVGGAGLIKSGYDLVTNAMAAPYKELREVSRGIQTIGRSQFGFMNEDESWELANKMKDFTLSKEGFLYDYNMEDLEGVMGSFASQGGFSNTRNAGEMGEKMKELIENFRQVMHILGTTQEEAASIMGELERRQMVSAVNAPAFASEMSVKGQMAGVSGAQLIEYGLGVSDSFRGTGYGQMNAFNLGVDASIEVSRLANSMDPYYRQNIYELGGKDAATQTAIRTMSSYYNSNLGRMQSSVYNDAGAGGLNSSLPGQMNLFADTMSSPNDYFAMIGRGSRDEGNIDFNLKAANIVDTIYKVAEQFPGTIGTDGKISEDAFIGLGVKFLSGNGVNITPEELRELLNITRQTPIKTRLNDKIEIETILNEAKSLETSLSDKLSANFQPLAKGWADIGKSIYEGKWESGKEINKHIEDISDSITGVSRIHHEDYKISSEIASDLVNYENSALYKYNNGMYLNPEAVREELREDSRIDEGTINSLPEDYLQYLKNQKDTLTDEGLNKLIAYLKNNVTKKEGKPPTSKKPTQEIQAEKAGWKRLYERDELAEEYTTKELSAKLNEAIDINKLKLPEFTDEKDIINFFKQKYLPDQQDSEYATSAILHFFNKTKKGNEVVERINKNGNSIPYAKDLILDNDPKIDPAKVSEERDDAETNYLEVLKKYDPSLYRETILEEVKKHNTTLHTGGQAQVLSVVGKSPIDKVLDNTLDMQVQALDNTNTNPTAIGEGFFNFLSRFGTESHSSERGAAIAANVFIPDIRIVPDKNKFMEDLSKSAKSKIEAAEFRERFSGDYGAKIGDLEGDTYYTAKDKFNQKTLDRTNGIYDLEYNLNYIVYDLTLDKDGNAKNFTGASFKERRQAYNILLDRLEGTKGVEDFTKLVLDSMKGTRTRRGPTVNDVIKGTKPSPIDIESDEGIKNLAEGVKAIVDPRLKDGTSSYKELQTMPQKEDITKVLKGILNISEHVIEGDEANIDAPFIDVVASLEKLHKQSTSLAEKKYLAELSAEFTKEAKDKKIDGAPITNIVTEHGLIKKLQSNDAYKTMKESHFIPEEREKELAAGILMTLEAGKDLTFMPDLLKEVASNERYRKRLQETGMKDSEDTRKVFLATDDALRNRVHDLTKNIVEPEQTGSIKYFNQSFKNTDDIHDRIYGKADSDDNSRRLNLILRKLESSFKSTATIHDALKVYVVKEKP